MSEALPTPITVTPDLPRNIKPRKIDISKAIDLRARGLSHADIGKHFDCSKQSVQEALQRYMAPEVNIRAFVDNRANILASKQEMLLSFLSMDEIKKMSPYTKVTCFAILYDKERLERDKSTANIDTHLLVESMEKMDKGMIEDREALKRLKGKWD